MRSNQQIVHVSFSYPPNLGGLEKVVQILAGLQHSTGKRIKVITSLPKSFDSKYEDEFEVVRLRNFRFANTIVMPGLLFNLLRLHKGDIVHLHVVQAYSPEMVWLASKVKGFRYVAHVHLDAPPSGPAGVLLKMYKPLILKRVLKDASFVVVFSSSQKKDIERMYGLSKDNVKVIPNGVEDQYYSRRARTLSKTIPKLLFVGRLNYQKNIKQFLNSLDGISDKFVTTIVGSGELEKDLKALAHKLKLFNVIFAGRAGGEKLVKYYEDADIFVLPSEREGMPLALLEAMAMGLPIVGNNVTGVADVVHNGGNGLLVPYNNSDALREAIIKITEDRGLYDTLSKTSLKLSRQYSWPNVIKQFDTLYEKVYEKIE